MAMEIRGKNKKIYTQNDSTGSNIRIKIHVLFYIPGVENANKNIGKSKPIEYGRER